MDHSLSTTWYRYTSRGAPSVPVPVTHVPAHVLPRHPVAERRRVGQAGGDHVARRDLDAAHLDRLGAVQPELVQRLQHVDELVAEPVLERHPPASIHRGISSTSSCSTFTHSTGPMPSGNVEHLRLAERLGGEPAAVPLPDHRRVQALLDRRPDRERRREVVALDHEVRRRRGRRSRRSTRTDGRPRSGRTRPTAPGSTPMPTSASSPRASHSVGQRELLVAELHARLLVRPRRGAGRDSDIAMSR